MYINHFLNVKILKLSLFFQIQNFKSLEMKHFHTHQMRASPYQTKPFKSNRLHFIGAQNYEILNSKTILSLNWLIMKLFLIHHFRKFQFNEVLKLLKILLFLSVWILKILNSLKTQKLNLSHHRSFRIRNW